MLLKYDLGDKGILTFLWCKKLINIHRQHFLQALKCCKNGGRENGLETSEYSEKKQNKIPFKECPIFQKKKMLKIPLSPKSYSNNMGSPSFSLRVPLEHIPEGKVKFTRYRSANFNFCFFVQWIFTLLASKTNTGWFPRYYYFTLA